MKSSKFPRRVSWSAADVSSPAIAFEVDQASIIRLKLAFTPAGPEQNLLRQTLAYLGRKG